MDKQHNTGFYILPFAMDGELLGEDFWEYSKLSSDKIQDLSVWLSEKGTVFNSAIESEKEISLRFTSANGAAIASFICRDSVILSCLMLCGLSLESDQQVTQMFIASVSRSIEKITESMSNNQLNKITKKAERPLLAILVWANDQIKDEEHSIVRNFSLHLAASFFKSYMR